MITSLDKTTYSILDIDLDYFNLMSAPSQGLRQLLTWAARCVSIVVDRHNHAFAKWRKKWRSDGKYPTHILHVDEHHDMMDERSQPNISNFMLHAMRLWPDCRVHWMVQESIDSPAMWIEDSSWRFTKSRFSTGPEIPSEWPRPDLVSVCTSPEFVHPILGSQLMAVVSEFMVK